MKKIEYLTMICRYCTVYVEANELLVMLGPNPDKCGELCH